MPADEFEIIRTLFAPLAKGPGARGLIDDAAVIEVHGELVVTTDAIVEGVHFLADDPVGDIAKKALRVNLSDLAGKGARPIGALLTLIWPDGRPASQIADFARGLGEDLAAYDVALWGGDTAATPGPMTISITAFGAPVGERVPSRADAKAGDDIWVTGTIGDAWLGFVALRGEWKGADEKLRQAAIARYRLPTPRTDLAPLVAQFANAAMDVSDGLVADAGKLARASALALRIQAELIPLSDAGRAWVADAKTYGRLFDWGDDYELIFTADSKRRAEISASGARVTRIGAVAAGEGVEIVDASGRPIEILGPGGHVHALGR